MERSIGEMTNDFFCSGVEQVTAEAAAGAWGVVNRGMHGPSRRGGMLGTAMCVATENDFGPVTDVNRPRLAPLLVASRRQPAILQLVAGMKMV